MQDALTERVNAIEATVVMATIVIQVSTWMVFRKLLRLEISTWLQKLDYKCQRTPFTLRSHIYSYRKQWFSTGVTRSPMVPPVLSRGSTRSYTKFYDR